MDKIVGAILSVIVAPVVVGLTAGGFVCFCIGATFGIPVLVRHPLECGTLLAAILLSVGGLILVFVHPLVGGWLIAGSIVLWVLSYVTWDGNVDSFLAGCKNNGDKECITRVLAERAAEPTGSKHATIEVFSSKKEPSPPPEATPEPSGTLPPFASLAELIPPDRPESGWRKRAGRAYDAAHGGLRWCQRTAAGAAHGLARWLDERRE